MGQVTEGGGSGRVRKFHGFVGRVGSGQWSGGSGRVGSEIWLSQWVGSGRVSRLMGRVGSGHKKVTHGQLWANLSII